MNPPRETHIYPSLDDLKETMEHYLNAIHALELGISPDQQEVDELITSTQQQTNRLKARYHLCEAMTALTKNQLSIYSDSIFINDKIVWQEGAPTKMGTVFDIAQAVSEMHPLVVKMLDFMANTLTLLDEIGLSENLSHEPKNPLQVTAVEELYENLVHFDDLAKYVKRREKSKNKIPDQTRHGVTSSTAGHGKETP